MAKTSSKDYRVRLFYFVFTMLLYHIWQLTDFLLKAAVDTVVDFEYTSVITAGECVEVIAVGLDSPD